MRMHFGKVQCKLAHRKGMFVHKQEIEWQKIETTMSSATTAKFS